MNTSRIPPRSLLGAIAAAALVMSAGCSSSAGHVDQTSLLAQQGSSAPPSPTARLVCGAEIRHDIAQTLAVTGLASGAVTWVGDLYTCTYHTAGGPLVLSVTDSPDVAAGRSAFGSLRHRLEPTRQLLGLAAFGLPAYETSDGNVVFLKDGKTLHVDATRLALSSLPDHQTRTDEAYAIAADVIGCWSE